MARNSFYKILTDDELFTLQKTDRNAENEFFRRYKIRVKWFLKSYQLNSLEREDLIQEGMIGLFQAIQTFDPAKNIQFSTYSNVCIRNRILNSLDALWKHKKKIDSKKDIDDIVTRDNPEQDTINNIFSESIRDVIDGLSVLEKRVLEGYMSDKSYKSIAQELEISPKKVDNILMKIKSRLTIYIDRSGLLKKGGLSSDLSHIITKTIKESLRGGPDNEAER